jgi:glutamyl-tRNA synthetase
MTVAVRFAPSPTGLLHVGNARVALVNWLFARKSAGGFLLRLDDTDAGRSREEYETAIREDLRWLGLAWDSEFRQSERLAEYAAAADRLRAAGRLYACYETPEELELKRRLQQARHEPPVYDRAALKLTAAERAGLEAAGRRPHWRFLLDRNRVEWDDRVRGRVGIDAGSLSDPVLVRADGVPLYTLCSVVDDIDTAITDVIRGEDHVTNTAVQIQIFAALGARPPAFAHLALLTGTAGEGLSKRLGSLSLRQLRSDGIEAMTLASLLARLGSADPVEPRAALDELIAGFDLAHFGRAPARFDPHELEALNARVLHLLPFAAVRERLPAGAPEDFWLAVRGNLARLADAAEWWQVVAGPVAPVISDAAFIAEAAALLPEGPFDGDTWGRWTAKLREASGRKGRALFMPLRLALTGRDHGPEMHNLLPLIGPARARARLAGKTA